jgi:hypothetical protein
MSAKRARCVSSRSPSKKQSPGYRAFLALQRELHVDVNCSQQPLLAPRVPAQCDCRARGERCAQQLMRRRARILPLSQHLHRTSADDLQRVKPRSPSYRCLLSRVPRFSSELVSVAFAKSAARTRPFAKSHLEDVLAGPGRVDNEQETHSQLAARQHRDQLRRSQARAYKTAYSLGPWATVNPRQTSMGGAMRTAFVRASRSAFGTPSPTRGRGASYEPSRTTFDFHSLS